jgi:hypothetical protein
VGNDVRPHETQGQNVRNGKVSPYQLSRLPKAASECSPHHPLHTLPSCRPSAGHLTGLSSLERARSGDPPIKIAANSPQCRTSPVPETRTCICAPPAWQIHARCNAGHSTSGVTENSACDAKAARGRAKKVGRGGTLNLKRGKENCHVNNHRQDPRPLEGFDFHPPHSSELFSESCHPSNQQKRNFEDAPALAVGESVKMTVRKFVHPFRRQICAQSRPQLR